MTTYLIKYQINEGEWLDTESRVVAGEDAREAVDEIVSYLSGKTHVHGFRLKSIEIVGHVDIIARGIAFDEARTKILQ